jgi:AcrR family transcriptional regulator
MDTIAREAGALKATVHAYFSSKAELFGAVVAREIERYTQVVLAGELDKGDIEACVIAER